MQLLEMLQEQGLLQCHQASLVRIEVWFNENATNKIPPFNEDKILKYITLNRMSSLMTNYYCLLRGNTEADCIEPTICDLLLNTIRSAVWAPSNYTKLKVNADISLNDYYTK